MAFFEQIWSEGMNEQERNYLLRREAREDKLASEAIDPAARMVHQKLAREYRRKLDGTYQPAVAGLASNGSTAQL